MGNEELRYLNGVATQLSADAEITIMQAVSGENDSAKPGCFRFASAAQVTRLQKPLPPSHRNCRRGIDENSFLSSDQSSN